MNHEITADWNTLSLHADGETKDRFNNACRQVMSEVCDSPIKFTSADITAMICAHMQSATAEFRTAALSVAAQKISRALECIGADQ